MNYVHYFDLISHLSSSKFGRLIDIVTLNIYAIPLLNIYSNATVSNTMFILWKQVTHLYCY